MPDRLRWGVLGTARINRAILPRLKALRRHELVAVASRDPARALAFARDWEIPHAVSGYDALLAREDIDAVYVPLPNALHAEWTVRSVHSGKHVLCEKPLAISVAEVDAMIDAVRRTGMRVAEALMYQHHEQTARVRAIVAGGDLGRIRLVRGCFSFMLSRSADVRWRPELGGGALWDIGCYPVSYARLVMGREPTGVFAAVARCESGVDEACAAVLDFGEGAHASVDCGFRAAFRSSIEIVGTDAVMHIAAPFKPGTHEQLVLVRGDSRVELEVEGGPLADGELEDMADQVLEGAPPRISLDHSRANVAALVALHRSASLQRFLPVAEAR